MTCTHDSTKRSHLPSVFILVLFFFPPLMQAGPTPDFPIGLTLTYQMVDEYFMSGTITDTETFKVLIWLTPDNASFMLKCTEGEGASPYEEFRNVSYPYWDYVSYDSDLNETVTGSMYALWLDVSDWERGQNVSISHGIYWNREYTVTSTETVEVGDVLVECWVAETSYVDTNGWEYTCIRHYDSQYGVFIKSYVQRWAGVDDIYNNGQFRDTLTSSNILDILAYHYPPSNTLDVLLIGGIILEITILIVLSLSRNVIKSRVDPMRRV